MLSDKKRNRVRSQTSELVTCPECGSRRMIVRHGLVCPNGHGKIIAPPSRGIGSHDLGTLREAWPELVSESPADKFSVNP